MLSHLTKKILPVLFSTLGIVPYAEFDGLRNKRVLVKIIGE